MKPHGEIDLNKTPFIVLHCGHFFTAETLDGHMGMAEVDEKTRMVASLDFGMSLLF